MGRSVDIHVLHVDDEPKFADIVGEFLHQEDDRFTVTTATSASDGLDRLAADTIDCVISDYEMPGQDGIEFLETVRAQHPDLPFILYTGKGSEEIASEAMSAGATDYLQKENGSDQYELLANRIQNAVEQYRAQERVAETERRLQTIAEHTNDVLWKFSADWTELRFINSAYETIWGRPVDELRDNPKSFLDGVHPEDRPAVEDAMDRVVSGESTDLKYRVNADEEFNRWVWVQSEPVFDDTGEVENVVGFARDITERKEHEQTLKEYRTLVQTVGDPMFVLDEEGYLTMANEAHLGYLDADEETVIGSHASEFMTDGDFEHGTELLVELIADSTREWATYEITAVTTTGDRVPAEINLTPLTDDTGAFTGTVGVIRDITERKEREQALERQNERLKEFAGIVSHDLRNPLNVAQGRLDMAREAYDSEDLDEAAEAVDRSLALIDDLLTLARQGEATGDVEAIDLAETSTGCLQNVSTAEATVVVETEQRIMADESQLKQVLENLFRNAIEHGGEAVTITVGNLDGGFYVEDDGHGISDDAQESLLDYGVSTKPDGTGFGLAIVNEIVENHGWQLTVGDGHDGGARFEITGVDHAST